MAYNKTIFEIERLLTKINNDVENIKKAGKFPQLDIDITMEHLRQVYEKVSSLNDPFAWEMDEPEKEAPLQEHPEPPVKETSSVKPVEKTGHMPEKKNVNEQVPAKEEERSKKTPAVSNEEKLKDAIPQKTIIADKFQEQADKSLAARIKNNPVSDLRQVIGINDKFLFVKELFKSDIKKYEEAIKELNQCSDPRESGRFLDGLRLELEWDKDNEYYLKLMELVQRKFV